MLLLILAFAACLISYFVGRDDGCHKWVEAQRFKKYKKHYGMNYVVLTEKEYLDLVVAAHVER